MNYWTDADRAELAVIVREFVESIHAHRETCPTCRALLAGPCPVRRKLAAEWQPYDLLPLDAPPGFYVDLRRRLNQHEAECLTCARLLPGHCSAVTEAIAIVFDWRERRELLTRAQVLRRAYDRHLKLAIGGKA